MLDLLCPLYYQYSHRDNIYTSHFIFGIGEVTSRRIDEIDRPIAFASCSLRDAEMRYSQLEKEALAIVFAVRKFYTYLTYLYGGRFILLSDHKSKNY